MTGKTKAISLVSYIFLMIGFFGALLATLMMPVAELLPAHIEPAKRMSGESCVRSNTLMSKFARLTITMLSVLPSQTTEKGNPAKTEDLLSNWQANIKQEHGSEYGKNIVEKTQDSLGGKQNTELVLTTLSKDKNFPYYAFAFFLGIAMFLSALAIQAVGRYDAEEKTILPAKK